MPLIEEHVLEVAFSNSGLRKISRQAAVACCSKLRLRESLPADLNPNWKRIPWLPGVWKSPASVTDLGVHIDLGNEYIDRLRLYDSEAARYGVWESYIDGDQYEVDGVVINGRIEFFNPLLEIWDGRKIASYLRVNDPPGLMRDAARAVHAVGIDDSPFCVEMRLAGDGWKVIDLHARLGEDEGLPEEMSDEYPIDRIERIASQYDRSSGAGEEARTEKGAIAKKGD